MPDAPHAAPVSHDLASWLAAVQLGDIPAATRTRAKHLLLDGIGCALVGARLPWSDAATDALTTLEGSGPTALIGTGRATTPLAAALLNSSYIQGFELDDYHPAAPVHGASLVIPAMLSTLPIAPGTTGADLLLGAIRGFEVGPRIGHALHGAQMLTRGWHSGPVFGGPAAAAAAGTLLQLDADQLEDAIGLAATQACGLMAAQFESMGKRMQHGFAARNGLLAATLAAGGYTGIKQVFERPYGGFLATFGEGHDPDPSQITDGLGERWETDVIAVKPYAAMAGLHAAIDAARATLDDGPLDCAAIDSITVSVSEPAFHHGGWRAERPLAAVGAQMNLAYAVAVTLLDGTALAAQFAPSRIDADDVWALIERTTLRHEPAFDERLEDGYNTRLEIALNDGASRTSFVDQPRGGLLKPLTNDEVLDKFRALTEPLINAQRAREIESMVLALEELNDAAELVELLAPPVDPIFANPEVPA
ncbi:MAG TPA: MmgE/PrpD family protein [Solirubrobacteraceae bacterium]|nr:MmgE/PrpD family protein [Solirubrobacteraceae bacterium]